MSDVSIIEYNRLKRENEELKRIIGLITLKMERGKKIEIVKASKNKKLIAKIMNINHKNIYYQSKKEAKDLIVKEDIEKIFLTHPAYGCRRLSYELEKIIEFLEKNKVKISVSDQGSPWQNSYSESFFSRFKTESGDLSRFEELGELIEYVFGYLDYYNRLRIHTSIKMSPYQFKQKISESGLEKRGT